MKKWTVYIALILAAGIAVQYSQADFPVAGGGTGTTNASDLSSGTLPAARIGDNTITNAKMLDATLNLAGGKFTGTLPEANGGWGEDVSAKAGIPYMNTGTMTWYSFANFMLQMGVTYNPADNTWIFPASITATEYVSSAADNTRGVTVPNTADPTTTNLAAGKMWVTDNSVKVRSNDNTVTFIAGSMLKTYSFGWDNAAVTDNNVVWAEVPRAITVTRIKCLVSTDNVVGNLQYCSPSDKTSCTAIDTTNWTFTSANAGVAFETAVFENPNVTALGSLQWFTASVGSALNKFSCTVTYR